MNAIRFGLIGVTALILGSCALSKPTGCLAENGHKVVLDLLKENVEKEILRSLDGSGIEQRIPVGSIRASLANIQFSLEDIRTSKEDPDSTKKFCASTLKAKFPVAMLEDAERAFELTESATVNEMVSRYGGNRSANDIEVPLDFTVQPTDDKKSIYGEIEAPDALTSMFAELVAAHILKSHVEQAKAAEDQAEAERVRLETEARQAERTAVLTESKARFQLSVQRINSVWAMIPTDIREPMTPQQVAFNRQKDAACRLEAAEYSTDATERESARLNCETRMMDARAAQLNRYVSSYY